MRLDDLFTDRPNWKNAVLVAICVGVLWAAHERWGQTGMRIAAVVLTVEAIGLALLRYWREQREEQDK